MLPDTNAVVIGLCGYSRSGKDAVADLLVKEHGFVKARFADALKRGLAEMFGLTPAQMDGDEKEAVVPWLGASPRHLMQTLGTEWGRTLVHPDVWVLATQRHLERLIQSGIRRIVISDVRFENEAAMATSLGSLVRIERPGVGPANSHVSEDASAISAYVDAVVRNDGTLEDLNDRVIDLVAACRLWDMGGRKRDNTIVAARRLLAGSE